MTRARTGYQRGVEAGYAQGYHAGYQVSIADALDAHPEATTITESMVERGAHAAAAAFKAKAEQTPWNRVAADVPHGSLLDGCFNLVEITRAILEAALTPKEQ